MDLESLTYEELDDYIMGRLVFGSDEMVPILSGHLLIERILEALISRHLLYPDALFKRSRSFDLKLDIATAMGLIDEKHHSAFKALNRIRNNYSHVEGYSVSEEHLNGLKFNWGNIQNRAFDVALKKSAAEAAHISTIFLCWKALRLIKSPSEARAL